MNISFPLRMRSLVAFCFLMPLGALQAFPPAPHHVIYGMVRNELGHPLPATGAKIIFETASGVRITANITAEEEPGVNYRLVIPMDSGLTTDPYKPHALQPTVPFRIKVQVGQATYIPIEMSGDFASLGVPAGSARINLTLGVDSDNDGLPDAWERWLIAMLGDGSTLASIAPLNDSDKDSITDYSEYIAGTYAFDPTDGFTLKVVGVGHDGPLIDILTIRGRAYSIYETADFVHWAPVQFRLATSGSNTPPLNAYHAPEARTLRIQVVTPGTHAARFFKARVD
jgi:hypothetical protein